jgi:hypothetical protein
MTNIENYKEITNCRLCKSEKLQTVLDFGLSPLANSYPLTKDEKENEYPLTVVKCDCCGHVQLKETINPEILFSNYTYASSDSPSLIGHFKEFASTVIDKLNIKENKSFNILEIGSNDGILLKEFANLGYHNLYGVEPATNIAERSIGHGATIINNFFNLDTAKSIVEKYGKMNMICANNVFAHVAEIDSMVEGIKELLSEDGVFIFENAYLLDTIKGLYFDQVYHEHLQYYGIKPLIKYLSSFDFEIFHIQRVNTQGGSFRIFAKLKSDTLHKIDPSVQEFVQNEDDFKLYDSQTYIEFGKKIQDLSYQIQSLIFYAKSQGKNICCYGCPAKFTLFSKVFSLHKNIIDFVVDDSPLKQNKFSPGAKIPIVNKAYFNTNPTDYCIVSVWNMADAIIKNNQDYKGKFVIPMPFVKIWNK